MKRMNDPHVVALVYRLEVRRVGDPAFRHDYSRAERIERDENDFRLVIEGGQARFEFKKHFPTIMAATHSLRDFVADWEMDAQLKFYLDEGPCTLRTFRLELDPEKFEVIDRAPLDEWEVNLGLTIDRIDSAYGLTVHPEPPAGELVCKEAAQLYHRFLKYKETNDPLPAIAYLGVTMLEASAGAKRGKRQIAAQKYHIESKVLDKVACLASKKGGTDEARKAEGTPHPLSESERLFLECAVLAFVRRMTEVAETAGAEFKQITMCDLPTLTEPS